jgi:hypothetical protein
MLGAGGVVSCRSLRAVRLGCALPACALESRVFSSLVAEVAAATTRRNFAPSVSSLLRRRVFGVEGRRQDFPVSGIVQEKATSSRGWRSDGGGLDGDFVLWLRCRTDARSGVDVEPRSMYRSDGGAGSCPCSKAKPVLVVSFLVGFTWCSRLSLDEVLAVDGSRCRCRCLFIDMRSRLTSGGSCGFKNFMVEVFSVLWTAGWLGVVFGEVFVSELAVCACVAAGWDGAQFLFLLFVGGCAVLLSVYL